MKGALELLRRWDPTIVGERANTLIRARKSLDEIIEDAPAIVKNIIGG